MPEQQGIIGDNVGIDLPQTVVSEQDLAEEKKMARFSKTEEFKRLKMYMEGRIDFYQTHLPDGRPVGMVTEDITDMWRASNTVIQEFKALINAYEQANDAVQQK
jgi:hypothetical protein